MTAIAPAATQHRPTHTRAIVGVSLAGAGAVAGGIALAKGLHMPPVVAATVAGAAAATVAGPSLLNMRHDNATWKSVALGAAPLAVVGGALGAFSAGWGGPGAAKTLLGGALSGAAAFGLAGGAAATAAHFATKQYGN